MILVCTKCKASYLVPATVFANGPRQVRCARCAHTWQADLPAKMTAMPLGIVETGKTPLIKPAANTPPQAAAQTESAEQEKQPAITVAEAPAIKPKPIPPGSNLPAIWRGEKWKKIRRAASIVLAIAMTVTLAWFLVSSSIVNEAKQRANHLAEAAGLVSAPAGDGLVLREIRSERRFEDGGMHLVVEGEIFNEGTDSKPLSDIIVNALGPDKKVIQSWRINPPAATLPPGATVPFKSSIVTPQGTVVEVNLSFAEPRNEP